jgi:hypothetical protein
MGGRTRRDVGMFADTTKMNLKYNNETKQTYYGNHTTISQTQRNEIDYRIQVEIELHGVSIYRDSIYLASITLTPIPSDILLPDRFPIISQDKCSIVVIFQESIQCVESSSLNWKMG